MYIKVKGYKEKINVADEKCKDRPCLWIRPDPGIFTQGIGYRRRPGKQEWFCGTREIHGCPDRLKMDNVS